MPRCVLPGERRSMLRRVVGEETTRRAFALLDSASPSATPEDEAIALHESGLFEDLKHDWLSEPILELLEMLARLAAVDLEDDEYVGKRLRREAAALVLQGEKVAELLAFFDLFHADVIRELVRPAGADALMLVKPLIEWMTLEADNESIDRGAIFEALSEHIDEHTLILRGLPWADQAMEADFSGMTPMDEMELLVGVRFADSAARWSDVCASLQRAGHDLCELGLDSSGT